jgi:hypothetical protein
MSCISNNLADFIAPPKNSTVKVRGVNDTTSSTKVGTVLWIILDDSGHCRTLKIRNTYYVPACPLRLLSPQHYSQQTKDLGGTYSTNVGDHLLFVWNCGRYGDNCHCHQPLMLGYYAVHPGTRYSQVLPPWVTLALLHPIILLYHCHR